MPDKDNIPKEISDWIEANVNVIGKESTAPDKETPDWLETDIRRGMKAMYHHLSPLLEEKDKRIKELEYMLSKPTNCDELLFYYQKQFEENKNLKQRVKELEEESFWTDEMVFRYAELYRWSSGRISIKGFRESDRWQTVDISEAKEYSEQFRAVPDEAVEFAEFASKKCWFDDETELWNTFDENEEPFRYSTKELYNLFKQSK